MGFGSRTKAWSAALVGLLLGTALGLGGASAQSGADAAFTQWLAGVRAEAVGQGISATTVDRAFAGLTPNARVIELDRRQPEFTSTFWGYFDRAVSDQRVAEGRAMLARHATLLARVSAATGVPPRVLVAFWGLETNYGGNLGGFNVIEALATLAYDGRRGSFFRAQLMAALRILDQGHIAPMPWSGPGPGPWDRCSSCRPPSGIMPSTRMATAARTSGPIWPTPSAPPAAFWRTSAGSRTRSGADRCALPAGFDYSQSDLDMTKPLSDWAALGLRRADGGALPVVAGMNASLLVPAGHQGPAFLVYDNFRVIMRWNNSSFYALAVGHLADRIGGAGALVGSYDRTPEPLRKTEVELLQRLLNQLGYQAGPVDGLVGPGTRGAIRRFQAARGLPADGYANPTLLNRVRQAAGSGG